MNERLKELRKDLGLTLEKFGKRIGVTKVAISNLEKGNRNITEQMFKSICREFNVNENWLRNGEGKMYNSIPNSIMEQLKKEYHLDEFSFNLVYEYLKLSDEKRSVVRELFQNAISAENSAFQTIKEDTNGQLTIALENYKEDELSKSTAELEEEYKKSLSSSARNEDFTALNTTGESEKNSTKNIVNK